MVLMYALMPSAGATAPHITTGFSPGEGALANVLLAVNSATMSVDVAAYHFTSREVATALNTAHHRGIRVRVVVNAGDNGGLYSTVTWLQHQGIPVRLNGRYAIQHNKFMIVDGKTLQTGSFNYTTSAVTRNAENTIVIWDHPATAQAYQGVFDRLWSEGH